MSNSVSVLLIFNGLFIHNPPNMQCESIVSTQKRAMLDLITLPNYTIYDPNGTDPAPVLPETITAVWWISQPTAGQVQSLYESWIASVGVRTGLTGLKSNLSTFVACSARLQTISDITPTIITGPRKKLEGVFVPITDWVNV